MVQFLLLSQRRASVTYLSVDDAETSRAVNVVAESRLLIEIALFAVFVHTRHNRGSVMNVPHKIT